MTPRIKLLVACVLLLGLHLAGWRLTEDGFHVRAGILFLVAWSIFILTCVSATRVRIKKPREQVRPQPLYARRCSSGTPWPECPTRMGMAVGLPVDQAVQGSRDR